MLYVVLPSDEFDFETFHWVSNQFPKHLVILMMVHQLDHLNTVQMRNMFVAFHEMILMYTLYFGWNGNKNENLINLNAFEMFFINDNHY